MKKILFIALMAFTAKFAYAQNGRIKINNHTDFDATVTLYADAATSCTAGACNTTFVTNPITLLAPSPIPYPGGVTSWGIYDPCGVSTAVGWASAACSTTWCPGTGIPTDFQWTLAEVDLDANVCWPLTFPVYVCPRRPVCSPASGPLAGPFVGCSIYPNVEVKWTSMGGTYANVVIDINQY